MAPPLMGQSILFNLEKTRCLPSSGQSLLISTLCKRILGKIAARRHLQAGNYATQNHDAWRQFAGASGASAKIAALMGTDPVTGKAWNMRPPDKQEAFELVESLSESPLTCPLCGFRICHRMPRAARMSHR